MFKNKFLKYKSQDSNQIQPHLKFSHTLSSRVTQLRSGSGLCLQAHRQHWKAHRQYWQ